MCGCAFDNFMRCCNPLAECVPGYQQLGETNVIGPMRSDEKVKTAPEEKYLLSVFDKKNIEVTRLPESSAEYVVRRVKKELDSIEDNFKIVIERENYEKPI